VTVDEDREVYTPEAAPLLGEGLRGVDNLRSRQLKQTPQYAWTGFIQAVVLV